MCSHDEHRSQESPEHEFSSFQATVLRYVLFPAYCRITSWDKAAAIFLTEGHRLIDLAKPLPPDVLQRRALVKPPFGIEKRARCWSAGMVLAHLIDVGTTVATVIVELSQGEPPAFEAEVSDVDPEPLYGPQTFEDYDKFLGDYCGTLSEDVRDRRSKLTHKHPWLGELTAQRWGCFAALHQTFHRRQMERIVGQLERG
jgi:hypothetical protein